MTARVYTHTYTRAYAYARAYIRARANGKEKPTKRKTALMPSRLESSKALSLCPLVHRLPVRVHVPDAKLHGASVRDGGRQLRNET